MILSVGNQSGAVKRRLVDMGLTPGTVVKVTKIAPLGDPLEVSLRGYELSLRKDDAAQIRIGAPRRPAAREAAAFYKVPPERVLVVSDDVALPPGRLRIRKGGSAGGHNGLKNLIQHLGTDQFPRVRVGVGEKPHPDYDMADWVLGKLQGEDKKAVDAAVKRAADAVECLIREGPDRAMSRYNG